MRPQAGVSIANVYIKISHPWLGKLATLQGKYIKLEWEIIFHYVLNMDGNADKPIGVD